MKDAGELISTKADFPNVEVYARADRSGAAIMTLSFPNPEFSSGLYGLGIMLALPGLFFSLLLLPLVIPAAQDAGIHWAVPVVALPGGVGLLAWWLMPPHTARRSIVIDTGRDLITAHGGGRPVVRQLSALRNLTTEPHPRGELERQKKKGGLGPFQKQHCLYGWFGARGAEKVELMRRYEYPPQNSLYEVLQAIAWAVEQSGAGRAGGREGEPAGERPAAARGIRPPLD